MWGTFLWIDLSAKRISSNVNLLPGFKMLFVEQNGLDNWPLKFMIPGVFSSEE